MQVKLELLGADVVYTPSVSPQQGDGLRAAIVGWVKDFQAVSKLMTRLDSGEVRRGLQLQHPLWRTPTAAVSSNQPGCTHLAIKHGLSVHSPVDVCNTCG